MQAWNTLLIARLCITNTSTHVYKDPGRHRLDILRCDLLIELVGRQSLIQGHWDKHKPTRPYRTQQHQEQSPPEWGCASWHQSCLWRYVLEGTIGVKSCLAHALSNRCQCWKSSGAPWSKRTSWERCFQMGSWVQLQLQEPWWVFMVFSPASISS